MVKFLSKFNYNFYKSSSIIFYLSIFLLQAILKYYLLANGNHFCFAEECQANLCEASEKNRQNQESLIDLNQQIKSYEAQIQTLKIEKSNLNALYQQVKQNLEIHEHDKLEYA